MNSNPRFGFIFSLCNPYYLSDIYEFEDEVQYASGCGYGDTEREAIVDACKNYCDGRQLWDIPVNRTGYLVEFDADGNVESVEEKELHLVCETTYSVEFDNEDKTTFFKATN